MDTNTGWQARRQGGFGGAIVALLLSAACAQPVESSVIETAEDAGLGAALAAGAGDASSVVGLGTSQNGISQNGISQNGISQNGLGTLGLTAAGISTAKFVSWFNADPGLANLVMRYVYRCAGSRWASLNWTNPVTKTAYSWAGGLGLAPGWTGGTAATVAEQQLVTACLGALTNKYGVSISIAVEGRTATGTQLAIEAGELSTYSVKEACFFGNLFANQGVYSGIDHAIWSASLSSARACAFDTSKSGDVSPECPPMVYVGSCSTSCQLDSSKTFYESCTYNGVAYKPLTTRLKPADVYKCGDDVCQFTETCGTRSLWDQCKDCGPCP